MKPSQRVIITRMRATQARRFHLHPTLLLWLERICKGIEHLFSLRSFHHWIFFIAQKIFVKFQDVLSGSMSHWSTFLHWVLPSRRFHGSLLQWVLFLYHLYRNIRVVPPQRLHLLACKHTNDITSAEPMVSNRRGSRIVSIFDISWLSDIIEKNYFT